MQEKKGISLIVLVITIIVMIILAAAIILSLNNAGIIGNANKAVDESNIDTIKAEADLKYAEYLINKNVAKGKELEVWLNEEIQHEGYVIRVIDKETVVLKEGTLADAYLAGTIKKGDYVTYKAADSARTENVKQYTLDSSNNVVEETTQMQISGEEKWRVLGINGEGEILLVLEGVASSIDLVGKEGYFNGEQILHDACSVFGKGEHATGARSITREDINKIINIDYTNLYSFAGDYVGQNIYIKYGLNILTGTNKTEIGWGNINKDINIADEFYHLGNSVTDEIIKSPYTFKNTYTGFTISQKMQGVQTTDNVYKMLFRNAADTGFLSYQIATKHISYEMWGTEEMIISYCMDKIYNGTYTGMVCVCTTTTGWENISSSASVKPVVSIDKNTNYDAADPINDVNTWSLK